MSGSNLPYRYLIGCRYRIGSIALIVAWNVAGGENLMLRPAVTHLSLHFFLVLRLLLYPLFEEVRPNLNLHELECVFIYRYTSTCLAFFALHNRSNRLLLRFASITTGALYDIIPTCSNLQVQDNLIQCRLLPGP